MSKTQRAQIPPHVHTNTHTHWCLYSFRVSHSHTPKRSHFLCQPAKLQLSFFLVYLSLPSFLSLSPLSVRQTATKTHVWHVVALYPARTQNQCLQKSERTYTPDALLNVLMWLNVPSKTTSLGREISFVWVSVLVCPLRTRTVLWFCWHKPRQFSWFNRWAYH